MPELTTTGTTRTERDPGGVGVGIQATFGALLVALGVTDVVAAKTLLVVQLAVSLATQVWVRAKAWPPAKVWLEALAAKAAGRHELRAEIADQERGLAPARRRRG